MEHDDLMRRLIKFLDIGYLTVIYFAIGITIAKTIDKFVGPFNKENEDKKSLFRLSIEIIIFTSFLGILIYLIRNLVEFIPFPLEGYYGFQHLKVKEVSGGIVIGLSLLFFQKTLKDKINYTYSRIPFFENVQFFSNPTPSTPPYTPPSNPSNFPPSHPSVTSLPSNSYQAGGYNPPAYETLHNQYSSNLLNNSSQIQNNMGRTFQSQGFQ